MRSFWFRLALAASSLAATGQARAGNIYVPLAVDEPGGFARTASPVTSGVPLPQGRAGGTDLVAAPGADIVLTSGGNVFRSSLDPSSAAIVEESGPLRTVVRADGTFRDAGGTSLLAYRARLNFYAGKSAVRVFVTLKN